MTPPNPLQELAENLVERIHTDFDDEIWLGHAHERKELAEFIAPILTASVGTLLQAERAAMIENIVQRIEGAEKKGEYSGLIIGLRELALADASALSAVVQRETAKLKGHLRGALIALVLFESDKNVKAFCDEVREALDL